MAALQAKAHLISAWCILTGIEILFTKLRTFGVHWGVWKKDPQLVVHGLGWRRREVITKADGTLKHRGIKTDMDASNHIQKLDCMLDIKTLGDKILTSISRSRDKCNAAAYCVRTNIG